MHLIQRVRRFAAALAGLAAGLVAFGAAPAFAKVMPPAGGGPDVVPQHLVPVHAVVTSGMPGWQITLIAAGAALLAAAVAVLLDRARTTRRKAITAPPEPCTLLDGPGEEAIRQHQAALGVPCGDASTQPSEPAATSQPEAKEITMSRIPRICRRLAVPAGLAPVLPLAAVGPAALANPGGAASMSAGVCPALGWLSFRRIVDIPFEACVAALESWQRSGQDGEVQIGQSRLRGPIKHDRDSGTCRIETRPGQGTAAFATAHPLDIDRWSPSSTAFELIPCGRVRPTAAYFRAGHILLDSLTHSLPQHVPTHTLAASSQSSYTRITANPFLANGCQEQTTPRGRR